MQPKFVADDVANRGGGEPDAAILRLEETAGLEYYDDITLEFYGRTKLGGYPFFCQPGASFGDGFGFVFQISLDEKTDFNVVGGSLMFAKTYKAARGVRIKVD